MIAIILAGGYGTRLGAPANQIPKTLLNVAGRPIVGHILDKLAEVNHLQRLIISTNQRFQQQLIEWVTVNGYREVEVVADRSYSDREKPGAMGSLAETASDTKDDCLIIAGDNLFTSSLKPMIHSFKDRLCPIVALHDLADRELTKQYSTATLDPGGRIVRFVEKPKNPESALIGTGIYLLPQRTLERLGEYLAETTDRDNMGSFIEWLCKREPVYGHVLDGYWWDIGTIDQYLEADKVLRLQLSQRTAN